MRNLIISLIVGIPLVLNGQNFNSQQFEERVKCSVRLLRMTPESDIPMDDILLPGFELVQKDGFTYHFRDPQGNPFTAYLHTKTYRVVYVEFTESNATFAEVQRFLTDEKKFEWVGAEHQWNYFNNKAISLAISPEMIVHVSLYDL